MWSLCIYLELNNPLLSDPDVYDVSAVGSQVLGAYMTFLWGEDTFSPRFWNSCCSRLRLPEAPAVT